MTDKLKDNSLDILAEPLEHSKICDKPRDKIPDILKELLVKRKKYKEQMNKESDPFKKAILDELQLAYKVIINRSCSTIF
jgi:DNA polymerase elongation subunit (family B)